MCKCGTLEPPLEPVFPIIVDVSTSCPGFTSISLKCPYTTLLPSSFKISTLFP